MHSFVRTSAVVLPAAFFLAACGGATPPDPDAATDMGVAPSDLGPAVDLGPRDFGPPIDFGRYDFGFPSDGGTDLGPPGDSAVPPYDAGIVGCSPDAGIHCDGDWVGQCTPACGAGECCSPQHGSFACAPRDASGACPLPDLFVDGSRIDGHYTIEWKYFAASDCALTEGCVSAPGWRRLLKFDTWTPNIGTADMYLGDPTTAPPGYFTYSSCPTHRHYHFNTYANYEVFDTAGDVVATGHKQAFCLEDFYHYPGMGDASGAVYTCGNQGIEMGWQDVYGSYLDCQWVDVTDVASGPYTLRVALNTAHLLSESDYDNDVVDVPISIPPDVTVDPTTACAASTNGTGRDCGWTLEGTHTCTPGTMVSAGCSAACGAGSCTGDTIMRVCDGPTWCDGHGMAVLGSNDDSGCLGRTCGGGGTRECCSQVQFTCPTDGQYTVLWAPYDSGGTATCTVGTTP